jgi:hypothetical protein
VRVIHLPHIVEEVHSLPTFASKRKELRGRKLDGVYFELEMAQYFHNEKLPGSFIPPLKGQRQCEFILCDKIYIECSGGADLNLTCLEGRWIEFDGRSNLRLRSLRANVTRLS